MVYELVVCEVVIAVSPTRTTDTTYHRARLKLQSVSACGSGRRVWRMINLTADRNHFIENLNMIHHSAVFSLFRLSHCSKRTFACRREGGWTTTTSPPSNTHILTRKKRQYKYSLYTHTHYFIVQELCESRGGRPGLSVLTLSLIHI